MSVAVAPVAAAGGQIRVTSIASTTADDGVCTLAEAIIAANRDLPSGAMAGECAAGSGADTITFAFTNATVDVYGGPPQITSDLTIDGGRTIALDLGGLGNVNVGQGVVALKGLHILHGRNVGVWNHAEATLTMTDSEVFGTTAGAGIYNVGTLMLQQTSLNGNTNTAYGGGDLRNEGSATVLDAVIASNTAANGPGIYSTGPLVVRRSTIAVNTTGGGSGDGIYSTSTATISASTLYQNAANAGGAIFNAGDMAIDNSTIAANTAAGGAGIYNTGTLAVTNATISRNSASGLGPGMHNTGTATLRNTILAGNTGTVADLTGNALAGGSGHNQVGPLAGGEPLADWLDLIGLLPNGGNTMTIKLVNSAINPIIEAHLGAGRTAGVSRYLSHSLLR